MKNELGIIHSDWPLTVFRTARQGAERNPVLDRPLFCFLDNFDLLFLVLEYLRRFVRNRAGSAGISLRTSIRPDRGFGLGPIFS